MLIELISRYYKLLWWVLLAFALFKIMASYIFVGSMNGIAGMLYSLFNWYGQDERELEDNPHRKNVMQFLNVLTLIIYGIIVLIAAAAWLMLLKR